MGANTKANTGGGALERGNRAFLEGLAQLGDTLLGVGALATPIEAAELVVIQPAKKRKNTPPFQNCNRLIQAGVLRCLQAAPCGTVALGTSGLEGPGRLRP